MCFSAEASFAASGVLAVSAIAIARIPKEKSGIPLSLFPGIFATHQFVEGILWLNHNGALSDEYNRVAVYIFAFIAFVLWPVYVPFAAYIIETGKIRRRIILLCQLLGIYISITLLICIVKTPIDVSVTGHSFSYKISGMPDYFQAPYLVSVAFPFLISSSKKLVIFGGALTLSSVIATIVASSTTFPSIWCFYAGILSLGLYFFFQHKARSTTENSRPPVHDS